MRIRVITHPRLAAIFAAAVLITAAFAASSPALADDAGSNVSVSFDSGATNLSVVNPAIASVSVAPAGSPVGAPAKIATSKADHHPSATVSPSGKSSAQTKFRLAAMEWLNRSGNRPTTNFGIHLENGVSDSSSQRPLVILIHGYNSCPQRLAPLQATISAAGYECGTFCYPNDQAIVDSADLLSQELHRLQQSYPNRKVALVTHSMGGLVAREVLENPALDPGNVTQLMMIAPPSQGTSCAYIVWSGDLWEHFIHTTDHNLLDDLYASLEDGLGEGREDLKPDSEFLRQLNARQRNPSVHYSIFIGTGSQFTLEQLASLRRLLVQSAENDSFLAIMEPALQRALDGFEDSAQPGDGVVSQTRAHLDGVADTVMLGFDHWNSIGEPKTEPVAALQHEILKRLAGDEAAKISAAR
jgi:pimeloyl-ACP methyl ester carboxylesterase